VLVVVAYLGMLLAALSLGRQSAPPLRAAPRTDLVVTLLDRPPVELPVEIASSGGSVTPAHDTLPRAAPIAPRSPKAHAKPVSSAAPTEAPSSAVQSTADVSPHISVVSSAAVGSTAAGPVVAPSAAVRGTAPGTGTSMASGTASARAGNDVTVLPFTDGMTRPKLLDMVEPQYTREARDANVKGLFLAKCVITTAGTLQKCRVVKGLPMMDQAVLSALSRWRYSPVIYQGKPVAVDYVIQVRLAGPE
jgi:TonB family protein